MNKKTARRLINQEITWLETVEGKKLDQRFKSRLINLLASQLIFAYLDGRQYELGRFDQIIKQQQVKY